VRALFEKKNKVRFARAEQLCLEYAKSQVNECRKKNFNHELTEFVSRNNRVDLFFINAVNVHDPTGYRKQV
jgi:hypothetical protein